MFSWLKYRRSFISRSVRKQNMEWSNGVIFLMATFWPDGLCKAELFSYQIFSSQSCCIPWGCGIEQHTIQHHTPLHQQHLESHIDRSHWRRSCDYYLHHVSTSSNRSGSVLSSDSSLNWDVCSLWPTVTCRTWWFEGSACLCQVVCSSDVWEAVNGALR